MRLSLLLGILLAMALTAASADQDEDGKWSVWSALVLATNEEKPLPPPGELASFQTKLKNIFGYNQFEIIGQHTELMDAPDERWLIPSKNFCLSVKSKQKADTCYLSHLELFQQEKMLASFDLNLGHQCPLFIRGPLYGNGQLIIVLVVK